MNREPSPKPLSRLLQFSLRQLGVVIVFAVVGSYSLANASEYWVRFWLTVYCAAQLVSSLLVAYRRDAQRAFYSGALFCGGPYLLLILSGLALPSIHGSPMISSSLITRFLPQTALEYTYYHLLPLVKDPPAPSSGIGGMGGGGMGGGGGFFSVPDLLGQFGGMGGSGGMPGGVVPAPPTSGAAYYPDYDSFLAVGHCLFGLIFAYLGGRVGAAIYLTRPPAEAACD